MQNLWLYETPTKTPLFLTSLPLSLNELSPPRGSGVEGAIWPELGLKARWPRWWPLCAPELLNSASAARPKHKSVRSVEHSSWAILLFPQGFSGSMFSAVSAFFLKQTITICRFYVYYFIPTSTIETITTELYFPARYLNTFYILLTPRDQLRVVPLYHSSPINNTRRTFAENWLFE